ncbi:MAG: hypothetical protein IPL32_03565 [Chloracidobacterium sp.]|nr:hypothetical protein [Chloracidobacterium sp.]
MAVLGEKVARIAVTDRCALLLVPLLRESEIAVAVSEFRCVHRPDIGKGGWSNTPGAIVTDDSNQGDLFLYIAGPDTDMVSVMDAESRGDSEVFGEVLGVPSCCRTAYSEYSELMREVQNDPVPQTAWRTTSPPPHPSWNNIAAQYFGYSLLSFAPCSLDCIAAQEHSKLSYDRLVSIDAEFAARFYSRHDSNIIYSEYEGIHRFVGDSNFDGEFLHYTSVDSTTKSKLRTELNFGDTLRFLDTSRFEIYAGSRLVSSWGGQEDTSVALFFCR